MNGLTFLNNKVYAFFSKTKLYIVPNIRFNGFHQWRKSIDRT
jgi:hypothetical protein